MAFNFPTNPTNGQQHVASNTVWVFTGSGWKRASTSQAVALGLTVPQSFITRALVDNDASTIQVTTVNQTATVPAGLRSGFACAFKGPITITGSGGTVITDYRLPGQSVVWCVLVQTGANQYDVLGGTA